VSEHALPAPDQELHEAVAAWLAGRYLALMGLPTEDSNSREADADADAEELLGVLAQAGTRDKGPHCDRCLHVSSGAEIEIDWTTG
jgi:hypothetical protein